MRRRKITSASCCAISPIGLAASSKLRGPPNARRELDNSRGRQNNELKTAIGHDLTRPEMYYKLGQLCEGEGNPRQAIHYYSLALNTNSAFQPAREALTSLGRLRDGIVN